MAGFDFDELEAIYEARLSEKDCPKGIETTQCSEPRDPAPNVQSQQEECQPQNKEDHQPQNKEDHQPRNNEVQPQNNLQPEKNAQPQKNDIKVEVVQTQKREVKVVQPQKTGQEVDKPRQSGLNLASNGAQLAQFPAPLHQENVTLSLKSMAEFTQEFEKEAERSGRPLGHFVFERPICDWPEEAVEKMCSERQAAWWSMRLLIASNPQAGGCIGGHDGGNFYPSVSLQQNNFRLPDPDVPIRYGNMFGKSRTPVAFLVAPPAEDLVTYLRMDPQGPFAGGPLDWIYSRDSPWWLHWQFAEDHEKVFKADWHAVPSHSEEAERFVPRLGKSVSMPRAPPRIEAFAEAFRATNRAVWSVVHDSIESLVHLRSQRNPAYEKGEGKLLREIANSLLAHGHFGVVEAQMRWGDGELTLPSHVDGITSLLHLGVTLGGRRTLRSATFPAHNTMSRVERNVWNEGMWDRDYLQDVLMTKGSIYMSSPYCFEHGVRYHSSGMNDPVIALQFRFALDGELGLKVNTMRDDIMRELTTIIAGVLQCAGETGTLRLPSIQDVQMSEKRLRIAARLRRGERAAPRKAKSKPEPKPKNKAVILKAPTAPLHNTPAISQIEQRWDEHQEAWEQRRLAMGGAFGGDFAGKC